MDKTGTLYIVATPIGNLGDITARAKQTLAEGDLIACEDTRHTKALLSHLGVSTRMLSVHEHNERERVSTIAEKLNEGMSVALVSDAGTPLISDPGYHLVHELSEAGHEIVPVPGASAVIAALSASGLPSDRFIFEGFLPAKSQARKKALAQYTNETRTVIFYESTHRIVPSIEDAIAQLGAERQGCIARELTKRYETIKRGTLAELKAYLLEKAEHQKGEFVFMLAGAEQAMSQDDAEADRMVDKIAEYLPLSKATALAAELTGQKKKPLYQRAIARQERE